MIGNSDQRTAGEGQQDGPETGQAMRGFGSAAPDASITESASYLNASASLEGELRSSQSVGIDGHFAGEIHTDEDVMVGYAAEVRAGVTARTVVVTGKLIGGISCATLDIRSSGRVIGNITTESLLSVRGAVLRGQSRMGSGEEVADFPVPAEQTPAAQAFEPPSQEDLEPD